MTWLPATTDLAPRAGTPRVAVGGGLRVAPELVAEVGAAFRDSLPVGLGFLPIGIAYGVYATHAGLPWWVAPLSALLIYGGSFEFLLVGLLTAMAPLSAIATTAFLVQFRHVFYTLSFPLGRMKGVPAKAYGSFAMTDEAYAMTTTDASRSWSSRRILALQVLLHGYWAGSSLVGALLGGLIPSSIRGLDFALTALFTVLAIEAIRSQRREISTPAIALASAVVARLLFPNEMLLVAFVLFTVALLARYAFERRTGRGAIPVRSAQAAVVASADA